MSFGRRLGYSLSPMMITARLPISAQLKPAPSMFVKLFQLGNPTLQVSKYRFIRSLQSGQNTSLILLGDNLVIPPPSPRAAPDVKDLYHPSTVQGIDTGLVMVWVVGIADQPSPASGFRLRSRFFDCHWASRNDLHLARMDR